MNQKFNVIDETEWKPITEPVWLFEIPMSFEMFKEVTGIEFEIEPPAGLGEVFYTFCEIGGAKVFLRSLLPDIDGVRMVQVYVQGQETDWELIKSRCCDAVGLSTSEILQSQTELMPGQWALFRVDDISNEIEMYRFPTQRHANWAKDAYTARGHKQDYYVRAAT